MDSCFIYVIADTSKAELRTKIGISNDPEKRLRQLQTGNPLPLTIHYREEMPRDRAVILESFLHRDLAHLRLKGEWFAMTVDDAITELKFIVMRWGDDSTLVPVYRHKLRIR